MWMMSKCDLEEICFAVYQRRKTIRLLSKPSTAQCHVDQYTYFLLSEPKYIGCCRLAEVLGISHHSPNRFLLRE